MRSRKPSSVGSREAFVRGEVGNVPKMIFGRAAHRPLVCIKAEYDEDFFASSDIGIGP